MWEENMILDSIRVETLKETKCSFIILLDDSMRFWRE